MTPLICMDEMITHQPQQLSLNSARPIASLGCGKRPVPITLCTEAETKRKLRPMGVKLMNNVTPRDSAFTNPTLFLHQRTHQTNVNRWHLK